MNINFFDIPSFDRAFILARKSNKTLPGSVRDNLSDKEEERLLEIIEGFEKDPTDLAAKKKNYDELMKLFYKGIGLDEKGKGTITKENQRAAFELSALMGDAILQDQQNIRKTYSSDDELKKVLELQNQFRKDLEKTDFEKLLKAKGSSYTELSEGQKEYQTEKITSYLAENKKDFKDIFEKLSAGKYSDLTSEQKKQLDNLKTLAGKKGQNILNDILHTFKEFKDYSFTNVDLTKMKETPGELLEQAVPENINANDNWERVVETEDKPKSKQDTDKSTRRSSTGSCDTRTLDKILARLKKLEKEDLEEEDTEKKSSAPGWLTVISGLADAAAKVITGLSNNNQDYCCYSPAPCYGGGGYQQHPICRRPYYVGRNTWPWGGANGINSEYSAFNNYMPSSGSYSSASNPSLTSSSNPYSSLSAPINIAFSPVLTNTNTNNNSPNQSPTSIFNSSNMAEIRKRFT